MDPNGLKPFEATPTLWGVECVREQELLRIDSSNQQIEPQHQLSGRRGLGSVRGLCAFAIVPFILAINNAALATTSINYISLVGY
jgi:hypothetical protein